MDVIFARLDRRKGGGEAGIFEIVVDGDGGDWDAKGWLSAWWERRCGLFGILYDEGAVRAWFVCVDRCME